MVIEELTSLKNFFDNISQYLSNKEKKVTIVLQSWDEVSYGWDNDCNIEYCIDNNIPLFDRKSAGGTIVHASGNIGIDFIYTHDEIGTFITQDYLQALSNFLMDKGLSVEQSGNDILVDGYKVASSADNNIPPDFRWCNCAVQVSINQNLELIESVCLKPMIKVPKGLSEWGITSEEIYNFSMDWINENFCKKE